MSKELDEALEDPAMHCGGCTNSCCEHRETLALHYLSSLSTIRAQEEEIAGLKKDRDDAKALALKWERHSIMRGDQWENQLNHSESLTKELAAERAKVAELRAKMEAFEKTAKQCWQWEGDLKRECAGSTEQRARAEAAEREAQGLRGERDQWKDCAERRQERWAKRYARKDAPKNKCFDPELHECRPCDCPQNAEPCGECALCINGHQACLSPIIHKRES